jgi:hypothetical protein
MEKLSAPYAIDGVKQQWRSSGEVQRENEGDGVAKPYREGGFWVAEKIARANVVYFTPTEIQIGYNCKVI